MACERVVLESKYATFAYISARWQTIGGKYDIHKI